MDNFYEAKNFKKEDFTPFFLTKSSNEEEEVNEVTREWVSLIVHDLKSPVGQINALLKLIDVEQVNEGETRMFIEKLRLIAARLEKRLQDSLRPIVSKKGHLPEAKQMKLLDLKAIFKSSLIDHEIDIDAIEASVDYDFSRAPEVLFHEELLKTTFRNLLSNSIKYRHPDRPLRIKIKSKEGRKGFKIIFKDNGLGIKKGKLKMMFKHGWRSEETKSTKGSGVGLHLIRKMLRRFNSTIKANSNWQKGSVFEVFIPFDHALD